jgi:hypothetical protein
MDNALGINYKASKPKEIKPFERETILNDGVNQLNSVQHQIAKELID